MEYEVKSRQSARVAAETSFRFGIEEEYFLCDAATLQPAMSTPESLFKRRSGARLNREMLQAQLEVSTRVHTTQHEARDELVELRNTAAHAAADHGLAILAAGTHPTANWPDAVHSPKERYRALMQDLQMVGHRDLVCGMHVHVELPDPDRRISVMTRLIPYVPLLLALSTSSPFWRSRNTGLKSYRLTSYDELPRSGLPELFWSYGDYEAYVSALVFSGAIPDATHIWWSLRPSHTYPTLELRATDCCTRLDDAVAIAALYRALVRYLYRNPTMNADINAVDRAIAVENKWIAQRYGVEGSFATPFGAVTVAEMLDLLLEQVAEDAEMLGCAQEVLACRAIVPRGTSADAQLRVFRQIRDDEVSPIDAVVRWIADASVSA
jgi:glutamate---cysteine ligase / carboxylate-amine ligase